MTNTRIRSRAGSLAAAALALLLAAEPAHAQEEGGLRLLGLAVDPGPRVTTVRVLAKRPLSLEGAGTLQDSRYVLDLPRTSFRGAHALYELESGPVHRAYLAELQRAPHPVTRLSVELARGTGEPEVAIVAGQLVLRFRAASGGLARVEPPLPEEPSAPPRAEAVAAPAGPALVAGARLSVEKAPAYDASYRILEYPGGDPGWERGCGVDVVIRAYRALGVDLQQEIHEDIAAAEAYGIGERDPNIDHRRVRNLALFLGRAGEALGRGAEHRPGDVVFWARDGDAEPNHVGVVSDRRSAEGRPLVIHHLGPGPPVEEDALFRWPIRGHHRWLPSGAQRPSK